MTSKSKSGILLVEALLALVFLGLGLVGVIRVFSTTTYEGARSDQRLVALYLGREILESITADRAKDGYSVVLSAGSGAYCQSAFPAPLNIYTCSVTFQQVAAPNAPDGDSNDDFGTSQTGSGYLKVTVTVFWKQGQEQIKLTTLLANWS